MMSKEQSILRSRRVPPQDFHISKSQIERGMWVPTGLGKLKKYATG